MDSKKDHPSRSRVTPHRSRKRRHPEYRTDAREKAKSSRKDESCQSDQDPTSELQGSSKTAAGFVSFENEGDAALNLKDCRVSIIAAQSMAGNPHGEHLQPSDVESPQAQSGNARERGSNSTIQNQLWLAVGTEQLISVHAHDSNGIQKATDFLKDENENLTRLPKAITAQSRGKLQVKINSESEISVDPTEETFSVEELKRCIYDYWSAALLLQPGQVVHGNRCRVSWEVLSHDSEGHFKRFVQRPCFNLPQSLQEEADKAGGRTEPSGELQPSMPVGHYLKKTMELLQCLGGVIVDVKERLFRQREKRIKIGMCEVYVPPDSVPGETEAEFTLSDKANNLSDSDVPITQKLGSSFKPDKPLQVKLETHFEPSPGKSCPVDVKSNSGGSSWKTVAQATYDGSKYIAYEIEHFCSHVAVITEEVEKNGVYHLFTDVWVHKQNGRILSLFWKYLSSLEKSSKVLEADHKRVIPLPKEIIVPAGSEIQVEVQSISHPHLSMISDDISGGRLTIDRKFRDSSFFAIVFSPSSQLSTTLGRNRYRFQYCVNVLNSEGKVATGGFQTRLQFMWPLVHLKELDTGAVEKVSSTDLKEFQPYDSNPLKKSLMQTKVEKETAPLSQSDAGLERTEKHACTDYGSSDLSDSEDDEEPSDDRQDLKQFYSLLQERLAPFLLTKDSTLDSSADFGVSETANLDSYEKEQEFSDKVDVSPSAVPSQVEMQTEFDESSTTNKWDKQGDYGRSELYEPEGDEEPSGDVQDLKQFCSLLQKRLSLLTFGDGSLVDSSSDLRVSETAKLDSYEKERESSGEVGVLPYAVPSQVEMQTEFDESSTTNKWDKQGGDPDMAVMTTLLSLLLEGRLRSQKHELDSAGCSEEERSAIFKLW